VIGVPLFHNWIRSLEAAMPPFVLVVLVEVVVAQVTDPPTVTAQSANAEFGLSESAANTRAARQQEIADSLVRCLPAPAFPGVAIRRRSDFPWQINRKRRKIRKTTRDASGWR
jgi:hypothetical protein